MTRPRQFGPFQWFPQIASISIERKHAQGLQKLPNHAFFLFIIFRRWQFQPEVKQINMHQPQKECLLYSFSLSAALCKLRGHCLHLGIIGKKDSTVITRNVKHVDCPFCQRGPVDVHVSR